MERTHIATKMKLFIKLVFSRTTIIEADFHSFELFLQLRPSTLWIIQKFLKPFKKDVAPPEAPSIYGAGKYHIPLVRRKVEVRVISLVQPSAPVIHLLSTGRLAIFLLLLLFLCSFFQDFWTEQSPSDCIHLQRRKHTLVFTETDFLCICYKIHVNLSIQVI